MAKRHKKDNICAKMQPDHNILYSPLLSNTKPPIGFAKAVAAVVTNANLAAAGANSSFANSQAANEADKTPFAQEQTESIAG